MWAEKMEHGTPVSIRVKVHDSLEDKWILSGLVTGIKLAVSKTVVPTFQIDQEVTFFSAWVQSTQKYPNWELSCTERTQIIPCKGSTYTGLIDLCCGLGGMTQGASYAGLVSLAGIDVSPLACEVFQKNHKVPIIHGSILDPLDLARVYEKAGSMKAGVSCGFPCPPFSTRGDAKGFKDHRAQVLFHALDAAYLLGANYVILECTPTAGDYHEVQNVIGNFAVAMNYKIIQQKLHLDRSWPCSRTRWWCLMIPVQAELDSLPDLPLFSQFSKVADVIPAWPMWTLHEDSELTWTSDEAELYLSLAHPLDFLLPAAGKCNTLLHSMGHHTSGCPCECRHFGLSRSRLIKDGLSLVALPSQSSKGHFRHLHPSEAGFLCTLPADFQYDLVHTRRDLPLIGNIAAPLQMQWTLLHGLRALQKAGLAPMDLDFGSPESKILSTLQSNISLRMQLWPTHINLHRQNIQIVTEENTFEISIGPGTTVAQLAHAHRQLLGWGTRLSISQNGIDLLPHALLQAGVYQVTTRQARHSAPVPTGLIKVSIGLAEQNLSATSPAGITLAELLRSLGINFKPGMALHSDTTIYYGGDRLWTSAHGNLRGAGPGSLGIHGTELHNELLDLIELLPTWQQTEIWLINPLLMVDLIRKPYPIALRLLENTRPNFAPRWIIAPILAQSHWSLLIWDLRTGIPFYYDGIPEHHLREVQGLCTMFQAVFHRVVSSIQKETPILQTDGDHCGALALHNFGLRFGLWAKMSEDEVKTWSTSLLHIEELRGSGANDYNTACEWLTRFLVTKGVEDTKVAARAALALKKLGVNPILKAINQPNPWQALKHLANQQPRPFQWIEHSELQSHIAKNAKAKFGAAHSKQGKKAQKKMDKKIELIPEQIQIADGSFTDEANKPLQQLTLEQITPEARGLVIATTDQASRFLKDQKKISIDALALLTTAEIPQEMHGVLIVQHMVWPGIVDSDPILVRGSCVQLGDLAVKRVLGKAAPATQITPDLLKLMVYRDQWPLEWSQFSAGPLRALVQRFDALKFCDGSECKRSPSCTKFHASLEEDVELVILDAFSWRWTDDHGTAVPSTKAQVFSIMIRVPPSATEPLLSLSANDGLYTELRAPGGRGSHTKFAVVWVKGDYEQAMHLKCQSTKVLHLVRFFSKYGFRCLAVDHETVHRHFHPKDPYTSCGRTLLFETGPWPYGITKQAMLSAFSGEGWTTKPIKPGRGSTEGRFWIFGADVPPPRQVINLATGPITITKIQETRQQKSQVNVVASLSTLQKMQTNQPPPGLSIDPLVLSDPWAKSKWAASSSSAPSTAPSSRFAELESQIKTSMQDHIKEQFQAHLQTLQQSQPMETEDTTSGRLDFLECNVRELKAQGEKFSNWFTEAGDRMSGIFTQVQRQDTMLNQMAEQVSHAVTTSESVQMQMTNLRGEMHKDLESSLARQTERLEALLAKKQRHE